MSEFKEFQGKTLDEAIDTACSHYDLGREKLEIEIITGGSTGVFGIMGVRKARVKARPRKAFKTDNLMTEEKEAPREQKAPKKKAPKREPKAKAAPRPETEPVKAEEKASSKPAPAPEKTEESRQAASTPPPRKERVAAQPEETGKPEAAEDVQEPVDAFADLDKDAVENAVREILGRMLEPIVGEAKLDVSFDPDRVKVFIDDEENSGLIIGREGQTLSSLQYLVNRLVSRRMETSVRIQIDTGDYRERQDDKLRQLAQHLADKAVRQGRTQSTKPLSSYHRRVVHLALQDAETVFTRSKGDGPLKRVLVVPKRRGNGRRNSPRN